MMLSDSLSQPSQVKTRAAIVYDFDGTLAPGSMHDHSFIPNACQKNSKDFWNEVKQKSRERDGDEILAYMQHMIECSSAQLTREVLREHGAQVRLFDGVQKWFGRLSDYANEIGLDVEHFVVSSGIKEMIEGCSIASCFKHIFASSFAYDQEGVACWPALAINYTT